MNKEIADYQVRVITEWTELGARIDKLAQFISAGGAFDQLAPWEQELLRAQLKAMRAYDAALDARIRNWRWIREGK